MTQYEQGFMSKCAEHGIGPDRAMAMMKSALAPVAAVSPVAVPDTKRVVANTPGHNKWVSYNHTTGGDVLPVLTPAGTNLVDSASPAPVEYVAHRDEPNFHGGEGGRWSAFAGRAGGTAPTTGTPLFRTEDNPGDPFRWWPGKWEYSRDWSPHGLMHNLEGFRTHRARFVPDYDAAAEILENADVGEVMDHGPNYKGKKKVEGPVKGAVRPRPVNFLLA